MPPRVSRPGLECEQDRERHDGGARPVGDLAQVEGKPPRQEHDFHRHRRRGPPGHLAEECEGDPREHVAPRRAAGGEHGLARAGHVRRFRVVADQLEREVGLDGAAYVERAARKERPAAVIALPGADIGAEPRLGLGIDFIQEVIEEDVFGGNGRVRFELEHPMAVVALEAAQAGSRLADDLFDAGGGNSAVWAVRRRTDDGLTSPVWPGACNLHGRVRRGAAWWPSCCRGQRAPCRQCGWRSAPRPRTCRPACRAQRSGPAAASA